MHLLSGSLVVRLYHTGGCCTNYTICTLALAPRSSIGRSLEPMTSQNGGQDGRHGSKMAAPRWPLWLRPSPDKGHDL